VTVPSDAQKHCPFLNAGLTPTMTTTGWHCSYRVSSQLAHHVDADKSHSIQRAERVHLNSFPALEAAHVDVGFGPSARRLVPRQHRKCWITEFRGVGTPSIGASSRANGAGRARAAAEKTAESLDAGGGRCGSDTGALSETQHAG